MTDKANKTAPSAETKAAEESEARAPHEADRPPTAEEEKVAPRSANPETAKDFEEMARTGAAVKGEGEVP